MELNLVIDATTADKVFSSLGIDDSKAVVVYGDRVLGIPFIAFAPFAWVAIGVYLFGKISMAHFNPAVTFGYLITKHIRKIQLLYYFAAEIIGALMASVFVKYVIGNNANLGANAPNYTFPITIIFGTEVVASALLMAVILVIVYTKGCTAMFFN
jgi:aquaporin Z